MEYRVKVYGREITSSAHSLTDDEVDTIYEYMDEMEIDDINTIGDNIEDVLGIDYTHRELWSVSKPLDYETKTNFTVFTPEGVEILNFDVSDLEDVDDIYNDSNNFTGFPNDINENVLVLFEEKKGFIHEFNLISKDEPKVSDFTYTLSTIGTPESEWDLIQEVQFKGIDLNPSYDEKWVRRINYEIELHVDSGF